MKQYNEMLLVFSKDGKKYGAEWLPQREGALDDKLNATRKKEELDGIALLVDFDKRKVTTL